MKKILSISTVAFAVSLVCVVPSISFADTNVKITASIENYQKVREQEPTLPAYNSIINQKINIEAALAYVQKWWNQRNPDYKAWDPNDCANYVSQILKAGGIQEKAPSSIAPQGIDSKLNYWYSKKEGDNTFTVSRTWINVEDFYTYWNKTQKVILPEKLNIMRDIEVGDVVQLQPKSSNRYSHIMFVVKKDDTTIYLTGHTNDREALDIQNIKDAYNFRVIKFS
ncbi:amidase domain-containing protein [Bacillus thuringiensis]|nr:amidase domain-containing protein [Bacillus thuringiensis]